MAADKFVWTVQFAVSPLWVADGFSIDDERATSILAHEMGHAYGDEFAARVIEAPSPLAIARAQGYGPKTPGSGDVVRQLRAGSKTNDVRSAMIAARDLLDSVAFVATEGDTAPVLAKLKKAIARIDGDGLRVVDRSEAA